MAKKPETIFREKFEKELKKIPNSEWESIQQRSKFGSPDLFGCINSKAIVIEFKKDFKEMPRPLQLIKIKRWRKAGAFAAVVFPENANEVFYSLNSLFN